MLLEFCKIIVCCNWIKNSYVLEEVWNKMMLLICYSVLLFFFSRLLLYCICIVKFVFIS